MIFLLLLENCICSSEFWSGSSLFLNITTISAVAIFIIAIIAFILKNFISKRKKFKSLQGNNIALTREFDPQNDNNPERPLVVLTIDSEGDTKYGGPDKNLISQIPRITLCDIKTIQNMERLDLFAVDDEE